MSSYISEPTRNTPEIHFDLKKNVFRIIGKSFPENSKKFYAPFTEWLNANRLPAGALIELQFDYISSSSVIAVLEVLKKIETTQPDAHIKWSFESGDDDMQNIGLNYKKLCRLPFEIVEFE